MYVFVFAREMRTAGSLFSLVFSQWLPVRVRVCVPAAPGVFLPEHVSRVSVSDSPGVFEPYMYNCSERGGTATKLTDWYR